MSYNTAGRGSVRGDNCSDTFMGIYDQEGNVRIANSGRSRRDVNGVKSLRFVLINLVK